MFAPVAEVDREAYNQPNSKPQPILGRQREHQDETAQDPQHRRDGTERHPERAMHLGMYSPHDQDRCAYNHERQQGTDIHQFSQDS